MDEKTMVNDILASVKSDLTAYQTAITECEDMSLRQAFQQIQTRVIINQQQKQHIQKYKQ